MAKILSAFTNEQGERLAGYSEVEALGNFFEKI